MPELKNNPPGRFFKSLLIFTNLVIAILYAEQIKVATYNILNFPQSYGFQRLDDFRIIMDYLKPDMLVVQEMESEIGVNLFLDSVLNYKEPKFSACEFHDGPDTDNALFYRNDKISLVNAFYLSTVNRDIARYQIRLKDSQKELYLFSIHFKAGTGSENELIRLQEATTLRRHLDSIADGKEILVMGDFNFYYDEPAYRVLVDSINQGKGRLCDFIGISGQWHENFLFSYLHTQSTRSEELPDGGAGGGLDDRFDFVLCTPNLLDTTELFLPKESFTIYGNDDNHFNKSVNSGINQSVPEIVADALYYASDHLPVYIQILDHFVSTTTREPLVIYPNPIKDEAHITFPYYENFLRARITITNITGQRMFEMTTTNPLGAVIRNRNMGVGIYFLHLEIETRYGRRYHRSKMAVVR